MPRFFEYEAASKTFIDDKDMRMSISVSKFGLVRIKHYYKGYKCGQTISDSYYFHEICRRLQNLYSEHIAAKFIEWYLADVLHKLPKRDQTKKQCMSAKDINERKKKLKKYRKEHEGKLFRDKKRKLKKRSTYVKTLVLEAERRKLDRESRAARQTLRNIEKAEKKQI